MKRIYFTGLFFFLMAGVVLVGEMIAISPDFRNWLEGLSHGLSVVDDLVIRIVALTLLLFLTLVLLYDFASAKTEDGGKVEWRAELLSRSVMGRGGLLSFILLLAGGSFYGAYELDERDNYAVPEVSDTRGSEVQSTQGFGGPYPLGGILHKNELVENAAKIAEFGMLFGKALFASKGEVLTRELLERSIKTNSNFPQGTKAQKYNYVVLFDDRGSPTIWVATWSDVGTLSKVVGSQCERSKERKWKDVEFENGRMVNIFPESTTRVPKRANERRIAASSPCYFPGFGEQAKPVGILDASSKHFLIAQRGRTLEHFEPKKWAQVEVAFAGELFVDYERKCTYSINTNSGTFRPTPGAVSRSIVVFKEYQRESGKEVGYDARFLSMVAELFIETLGAKPSFIQYGDGAEERYFGNNSAGYELNMCAA